MVAAGERQAEVVLSVLDGGAEGHDDARHGTAIRLAEKYAFIESCLYNVFSQQVSITFIISPVEITSDIFIGNIESFVNPSVHFFPELDYFWFTGFPILQHLLGEHDFSSFRASACQALSPVKTLRHIGISRQGAYWRFEFEANAFLHHMIRNIMGCLIMVGDGRHSPEWVLHVLAARNRDAAAPTFSPNGLYFVGPRYDAQWGLPERPSLLDGLPGA